MSTLLSSEHNCTIHFVNELHPRFSCCICLHVADEPLYCGNKKGCTGVFCTKCLNTALVTRKECPLCKIKISGQPTKNNIVKEMIYDEIIYCIFVEFDNHDEENSPKRAKTDHLPRSACQWTGPLKDLEAHLAHECEFTPTPCTNEGCTLTPTRGQLALHCAKECQFRVTPCTECAAVIRVLDTDTHLRVCPHCHAPYLREDHGSHELACPEMPITCTYECHGCSVTVVRKTYNQHQVDNAIKHSELVASVVNSMKKVVTDLQNDMLALRQSTTALASPISTVASVQVVNFDWTETAISALLASNKLQLSDVISLNHDIGRSKLYVSYAVERSDALYIKLYKYITSSTNKGSVSIAGSTITLLHPSGDPSRHVTRTYVEGATLLDNCWSLGWSDFVPDVKPFIFPNDSISIKCVIKYAQLGAPSGVSGAD